MKDAREQARSKAFSTAPITKASTHEDSRLVLQAAVTGADHASDIWEQKVKDVMQVLDDENIPPTTRVAGAYALLQEALDGNIPNHYDQTREEGR